MQSKMFGTPGSLGGLNGNMNKSDPALSSRSKTGLKKVMFDPKAAANITSDKYIRDQLINANLNNVKFTKPLPGQNQEEAMRDLLHRKKMNIQTTEEEQYAFEAKVKEMTEMVMKDYKRRKSELKPIAE